MRRVAEANYPTVHYSNNVTDFFQDLDLLVILSEKKQVRINWYNFIF